MSEEEGQSYEAEHHHEALIDNLRCSNDIETSKSPSETTIASTFLSTSHVGTTSLPVPTPRWDASCNASIEGLSQKMSELELRWSIGRETNVTAPIGFHVFDDATSVLSMGSISSPANRDTRLRRRGSKRFETKVVAIPAHVLANQKSKRHSVSSLPVGITVFDRLYNDASTRRASTSDTYDSRSQANSVSSDVTSQGNTVHTGASILSQISARTAPEASDSVFHRLYRNEKRRKSLIQPSPTSSSSVRSTRSSKSEGPNVSILERRLRYKPPSSAIPKRRLKDAFSVSSASKSHDKDSVFERLHTNTPRPKEELEALTPFYMRKGRPVQSVHKSQVKPDNNTNKEDFVTPLRTNQTNQLLRDNSETEMLNCYTDKKSNLNVSDVADKWDLIETSWSATNNPWRFEHMQRCASLIQHSWQIYKTKCQSNIIDTNQVNYNLAFSLDASHSERLTPSSQSQCLEIEMEVPASVLMVPNIVNNASEQVLTIEVNWHNNEGFETDLTQRSILCIQRFWRAHLFQSRHEKQLAVMRIQHICRDFCRLRAAKREAAAIKVQVTWSNCYYHKRFTNSVKQIVRLQAIWRMLRCRKQFESERTFLLFERAMERSAQITRVRLMYIKEEQYFDCAIQIQAWWRSTSTEAIFSTMKTAAVLVQACYRCYYWRTAFVRLHYAVSVSQRMYRLKYSRLLLLQQQLEAAVCIQSWRRMVLCLVSFRHTRQSTKSIQHVYRAHFKQRRTNASIIQNLYQTYRCRCNYINRRRAALRIQRVVRNILARRYIARYAQSVLCLQRTYRAFYKAQSNLSVSATKIQYFIRLCQRRSASNRRHKAAVVIQSLFRSIPIRLKFEDQRKSAILIQRWFRGWYDRKTFNDMAEKAAYIRSITNAHPLRSSSTTLLQAINVMQTIKPGISLKGGSVLQQKSSMIIQVLCSAYCAHKIVEYKEECATIIQSYYRCHQQQITFNHVLQATVLLQRHIRGMCIRNYLHCCSEASCRIQACVRAYNMTRLLGRMKSSATKIQLLFRVKQHRKAFIKFQRAVSVLQSFVRRVIRVIKQNNINCRLNSALIIQDWFRLLLNRQKLKYIEFCNAVLCVQKVVRGSKVRQTIKLQNTMSIQIQKTFRAYFLRQLFLDTRRRAIVMQTRFRMYRSRVKFIECQNEIMQLQKSIHARNLLKTEAVTRLQSWFRAYQVRNDLLSKALSVIIIQSFYRCCHQRIKFLSIRKRVIYLQSKRRSYNVRRELNRQLLAAGTIQHYWFVHCVRKSAKRKLFAVRSIQSIYRAYSRHASPRQNHVALQKTLMQSCLEPRVRAALRLQRLYRQYRVRNGIDGIYCFESKVPLKAVISFQSIFRGSQVCFSYKQQRKAAIRLQNMYLFFRLQKLGKTMTKCATMIQSAYRGHFWFVAFLLKCQKIILMQSIIRTFFAKKLFQYKVKKILQIQSLFRGFHVRAFTAKQNVCALIIQMSYRAFVERSRAIKIHSSAIVLQRFCRGNLARHHLTARSIAATSLQRIFCFYRAQKKRLGAAVAIQSFLRSHFQHLRFIKTRNTIVSFQHLARVAVHNRVKRRKAATDIQRIYRAYFARTTVEVMVISLVTIQSFWRSKIRRLRYMRFHRAAAVIQCFLQKKLNLFALSATKIETFFRLHVCRIWFRKLHYASLTVQTFYRRRHLLRKKLILCLQSQYRLYSMRRRRHLLRVSVITLQSSYRTHCQRAEFLRLQKAVVLTQAFARGVKVRQAIYLRNLAALCLQRWLRGMNTRTNIRCIMNCIIKVQSFIRVCLMKKSFNLVREASIVVQRTSRGFFARLYFCNMRKVAIFIQRRFRTLQAQSTLSYVVVCTITLQALYRAYRVRYAYKQLRKAVLLTQRVRRGNLSRRVSCSIYSSALKIQRWIRSLIAKKVSDCITACVVLQSHFRSHRISSFYQNLKRVALLTQRLFRGARVRKKIMLRCLAVIAVQRRFRLLKFRKVCVYLTACATLIQSFIRSITVLRAFRVLRNATINAQRFCRGFLDRRYIFLMNKAAVCIQKKFRDMSSNFVSKNILVSGVKLLTSWKEHKYQCLAGRLQVSVKIVHIQCAARGMIDRKCVARRHQAATVIECYIRRHLALRKTQNLLVESLITCFAKLSIGSSIATMTPKSPKINATSITFLQTSEQRAVLLLQSTVRGFIAKAKFRRFRRSIVQLQKLLRHTVAYSTCNHAKMISSAKCIEKSSDMMQTFGSMTKTQYKEKQQESILLQSTIKSYLFSKTQLGLRAERAAKTLQKIMRRFIVQTWYCRLLHSLLRIQTLLKSAFARRKYLLILSKVVLMQAVARSFISRKFYARARTTHKAAVQLQQVWRGYWKRLHFSQFHIAVLCLQAMFRRHLRNTKFSRSNTIIHQKLCEQVIHYQIFKPSLSKNKVNIINDGRNEREKKSQLHALEVVQNMQVPVSQLSEGNTAINGDQLVKVSCDDGQFDTFGILQFNESNTQEGHLSFTATSSECSTGSLAPKQSWCGAGPSDGLYSCMDDALPIANPQDEKCLCIAVHEKELHNTLKAKLNAIKVDGNSFVVDKTYQKDYFSKFGFENNPEKCQGVANTATSLPAADDFETRAAKTLFKLKTAKKENKLFSDSQVQIAHFLSEQEHIADLEVLKLLNEPNLQAEKISPCIVRLAQKIQAISLED